MNQILSESRVDLKLNPKDAAFLRDARKYDQADQEHPNFSQCQEMACWTVQFHDGLEGDVKICNGDTGPWMELVIFEDGSEIAVSEVSDVDFGEISAIYDGEQFIVDVFEACPCDSGHPERCPDVGLEEQS